MGLRGYLLKRLINTLILLIFVIVLNFAIFELLPGEQGSITNLFGNPKIQDPKIIQNLEIRYGICKGFDSLGHCIPTSVWDKFVSYFYNMLTLQFGNSLKTNHPVIADMNVRLLNTLTLLGVATALSLVIGIMLGVLAGYKRGGSLDSGMVTVSLTTYSLPTFFIGLLFILIFAQNLGWFPSGLVQPSEWILTPPSTSTFILVRLKHLFLPAATLTLFFYGGHLLLTRATMTEALTEDYITTARAKGLPERTVLFKHALKNASLPIVTNAALSFGTILSGAIITETVFAWDGLGRWLFQAINWKDFPVLQAMFFIIALCVIAANLISDVVYGMLDPRIRYE
jgi:peptide/nickel transport system permease protein